jgi:hypothetical protein
MYAMYYTSMLWCSQLIMILVRTNHPFLRVRRHNNKNHTFRYGDKGLVVA